MHRHRWTVTRRTVNTGHPLIRACKCGAAQRFHGGRWVDTTPAR